MTSCVIKRFPCLLVYESVPLLFCLVAASLLDIGSEIRASERPSIDIPVLVTHGSADTMTCPSASRLFVERVACVDKTFYSFPEAYHNCIPIERFDSLVHLDIVRDEVIELYLSWIARRSEM
jgi:alpha-beta hydrolase superfamily lysophospholipase